MAASIKSEVEDGICTLIISNPGKRNAIGFSLLRELIATFDELADQDNPPVIVLKGEGEKAFSAGFDLTVDRTEQTDEENELWPTMIDRLKSYEAPTIAMVNGDTYGGAMEIICTCDIRVGVDYATFGITPAKIGLVYKGTAIQRVIQVIGFPYTKELIYTGEPIDAQTADEIGLLNHLVSSDELEEQTYELASTIASNAPLSLKYMKQIFRSLEEKQTPTKLEQEWVARVREETFQSHDHQEGVAAFNSGSTPEFRGE